ncbi:MAG TPA: hypothetical protein VG099_06100, partial [Gemmataceae bacterium]|nr:hypothetical protein [Gemmataceae bacterium]
ERRDVQLGTQQGLLQVIARGLNPGERVVVDGLQKVRPGQTVNFEVIPMGAGVPAGQPHGPTSKTGPGLNPRPQPAPVMQQNMPPRGKTR